MHLFRWIPFLPDPVPARRCGGLFSFGSLVAGLLLNAPGAAFAAEPVPAAPRPTAPGENAHPPPNPRLTGIPFTTTWDADDYGGSPATFHIVQHPQTGFIYLGHGFGLSEYDGATWRSIPFRDGGSVSIVVIDRRGTVWLGGSNDIAALRPNSRGELQPVAVTERLPVAERTFGRLYVGAAGPDGVYFASPTTLVFFGDDGTTRSWPAGATNFNGLCWFAGALHASKGAAGLMRLERGAFVSVATAPRSPNPALADTLRLFGARPESGRAGALLLTNVGPMQWSGPGAPLTPLSTAVLGEFADESAIDAAFLPDGRMAFSFPRRGLLILAADGAVSVRLDPAQGFPSGRIEHLAPDNQGGLWLARANGLARLQVDSRYATQGTFDGARAFLRHGERLYISCFEGAGWRDDATGRFHPVTGMPTSPSSLFSAGGRVFCTGQFLRELTPDDRAVAVLRQSFNSVVPLRDAPGAFVGGTLTGLRLLHFDGSAWRDEGVVPSVHGGIRQVSQDSDGFVWALGYRGSGSWRVDFRAGAEVTAPAEYFDDARGLPIMRGNDPLRFFTLGGETLTVRSGKLLRYDRAAARFVPEDRLESARALDPIVTAPGADGDHWWLVGSPGLHLVHVIPTAENRWRAEPLSGGSLHGFVPSSLHYDHPTSTIWISGRVAPISVDPHWNSTQPIAPLRATVRRLSTAAGELLWAGSGVEPLHALPATVPPTQNSLRFTFAASAFTPNHRGATRLVFRTRLEGLEDEWTSWSPTPWREFSHLPYREFIFHVQARDLEDRESTVGALTFAIAPPWWRARPAVAGYALAALLALSGIFRLRTRALYRRNAQLESLVAARTVELANQNVELARLNRLELDEKISARLAEEKARLEVLRYQLNPHFLYNALNSIYGLALSTPRAAADMTLRLANFCRVALVRGEDDRVTLGHELDNLAAYLHVEQARWGDSLVIEIEADATARAVALPPFLLLPLVENAIKYGGATSPDRLTVRLAACVEGATLVITVANTGTWVAAADAPGAGARPSDLSSTGIGLTNLRQRLARYYPEAHELTTEANDGWVIARLKLSVEFSS